VKIHYPIISGSVYQVMLEGECLPSLHGGYKKRKAFPKRVRFWREIGTLCNF